MIGLPTSVISRMSCGRDPRLARELGGELRRARRGSRSVIIAAPPGFIIAYETRLIRSSPKRICGFIVPAAATSSPVSRSHRCAATVVEPTSTAMPKALSWKPGHTRDDLRGVVHGDRDFPLALAQRGLQLAEDREVAVEPGELPLALERILQAAQVAGRVVHVGLAHLDVVQAHDRVQLDLARVGVLAHDLAVDLAAGRHVDDDVALRRASSRTADARPAGRARLRVALLRSR